MDVASSFHKLKAAQISIFVSCIVLALKFWAYWISGSTALFSDALETIVNVITSVAGLFVIRYVSQPKDDDHPYGHGKAEYFSSAFEGGLVLFAALTIGIEAVSSFSQGPQLKDLNQGLLFILLATILNFLTAQYLKKVGEREKSIALKASAQHIMSDVVTTVGVFIALMLVRWTGWLWLDAVIAGVISLHLLVISIKILRTSVAGLTDEIDNESLQALAVALEENRQPGVVDVHETRSIRSGSFHHIDAHVVVPEFWNVSQTHDFLKNYESKVVHDYPYEAEIAFHVDPCQRKYCDHCDLENCPIRQTDFEGRKKFAAHDIVKD